MMRKSQVLLKTINYVGFLSPLHPIHLVIGIIALLYIGITKVSTKIKYTALSYLAVITLLSLYGKAILLIPLASIIIILYYLLIERYWIREFIICILAQIASILMIINGVQNITKFLLELHMWSLTSLSYYTYVSVYMILAFFLPLYDIVSWYFESEIFMVKVMLTMTVLIIIIILISFSLYVSGNSILSSKLSSILSYVLFLSIIFYGILIKLGKREINR